MVAILTPSSMAICLSAKPLLAKSTTCSWRAEKVSLSALGMPFLCSYCSASPRCPINSYESSTPCVHRVTWYTRLRLATRKLRAVAIFEDLRSPESSNTMISTQTHGQNVCLVEDLAVCWESRTQDSEVRVNLGPRCMMGE